MSGYLAFNRTGNIKVDAILDLIENAGDAFHHTSEWNEPIEWEDNKSYIDLIDEAINNVAASDLISRDAAIQAIINVGGKRVWEFVDAVKSVSDSEPSKEYESMA